MTNPFEAYGETRSRRPMRAKVVKSDADAPMKPTEMEKKQRAQTAQLRLYREYWREQIAVTRNGPAGSDFIALEKFLRKMTIDDGEALIDLVQRSRIPKVDWSTKRVALHIIADAIEHVRAVNGYPPFDDSLPGEPPKVFERIREMLT